MKLTKILPICCVLAALSFASCSTTKAEEVAPVAETTVEMEEVVPAETVAEETTEEAPAVEAEATEEVAE